MDLARYIKATRKSILERKTSLRRFEAAGWGVGGWLAGDVLKFVFLYQFFIIKKIFLGE